MVMEAEKGHSLPSANWIKKGCVKFSLSPKAGRIRSSAVWLQEEISQLKRQNQPFLHLFVPSRPPTDWMMPHPPGSSLLGLMNQMIISSRNTLSHTSPEITFYRLSGHPLGQLSWHISLIHMLRMPSSLRTKLQPGSVTYAASWNREAHLPDGAGCIHS